MQTGARLQIDEILALVRRHKEWEAKLRRDYHGYPQTREPQAETFEQHLERYGFLARIGEGATPQELEELQALAGVSLPPELREFYTFFGELQVSNPGESACSARKKSAGSMPHTPASDG